MTKRKDETSPIYMIRTGSRLAPVDEIDLLTIEALPIGTPVEVSIKIKRNDKRLKAYWVMLHEVVQATGCAISKEALHELVKLKTGHVELIKLGEITVEVPSSISFTSMSEPEMINFFEHAKQFLAEAFGYFQEKAA